MTALSLLAAAREHPRRLALVTHERSFDYAGLGGAVEAELAASRPEGPWIVTGATDEATVVRILAALEVGRPLLLLHPRWTEGERARALEVATGALPSGLGHDATAAVVFTSGTSGEPKAAVLSRRAFLSASAASAEVLGWEDGDAWLAPMPMAHVGGLSVVVRALVARRAIVLPRPGRFEEAPFAEALEHATLASVVPTMLERLTGAGITPPSRLRAVLVGGAACPPRVLARAAALGWPLRTTYGLTEACAQVATARRNVHDGSEGAGLPLPGVEVRALGGSLRVRSPAAMDGFLSRGVLERPFDAHGFYDTGDDGTIDAEGRVHVLGRRTDLIVTGGENVRPLEVEAALEAIEGIEAACVFGLPDERWGAVVAAAIVGPGPSDEEILRRLRDVLAPFKLPRRIVRLPALVTAPSGKLDRKATAALAQGRT